MIIQIRDTETGRDLLSSLLLVMTPVSEKKKEGVGEFGLVAAADGGVALPLRRAPFSPHRAAAARPLLRPGTSPSRCSS